MSSWNPGPDGSEPGQPGAAGQPDWPAQPATSWPPGTLPSSGQDASPGAQRGWSPAPATGLPPQNWSPSPATGLPPQPAQPGWGQAAQGWGQPAQGWAQPQPPGGYLQPYQAAGYPQPVPALPASGMAVASLVLGITSIVFSWWGIFTLAQIVLALVFGVQALNKANAGMAGGRPLAIAGIVCGCVGVLFYLLIGVFSLGIGFII